MKRILSLATLLLLAVETFAYDAKVDGIYYNFSFSIFGEPEATVTYFVEEAGNVDAYKGSVVIPSTVTYDGGTYTVKAIGEKAFRYCTGITSITIPPTVTSIGYSACVGCSGLTSITIPNSVTTIGSSAFYNCI